MTWKKLEKTFVILQNKWKITFVSLYCDRSIHDAIWTGKIPENTRLRLCVFYRNFFPVEMSSFVFLSQYTQTIFCLLNVNMENHFIFLNWHACQVYPPMANQDNIWLSGFKFVSRFIYTTLTPTLTALWWNYWFFRKQLHVRQILNTKPIVVIR